jgi:hypothetical protein
MKMRNTQNRNVQNMYNLIKKSDSIHGTYVKQILVGKYQGVEQAGKSEVQRRLLLTNKRTLRRQNQKVQHRK